MKVFIDIGHPAHVHYFKNFIRIIEGKGGQVRVTARDKEITNSLLEQENINFFSRGKGGGSIISKCFYLLKADKDIYQLAKDFNADIHLSFASPYLSHVSKILKKPHIAFSDTEHNKIGHLSYRPFTNIILTPNAYRGKDFKKQIRFEGYMETCYLHPNHFQPDKNVLKKVGLREGQPFSILRFVSWNAIHDIGHTGINTSQKIKIVNKLNEYGRVLITSEGDLPSEIDKYRIKNISVSEIHHVLAFASLMYGESATMASESAMLGVPSIFHDDDGRGYTDEQEKKYGLVFNYSESKQDQQRSLQKAVDILENPDSRNSFQKKKKKLLEDKIDVTAFMVWFVENYPESKDLMLDNLSKQFDFK